MTDQMKKTILPVFLLFLSTGAFCQPDAGTCDLRQKVVSIIVHQIGYLPDSTTNKLPSMEWDASMTRGLPPSFSSLPANPMTLLILDGLPVELDALDDYALADVDRMSVYPKDDITATAFYGTRARNGLIVLQMKE